MSSPLLSALADLDGTVQGAEAQLDRLAAGLPIDEQRLMQSLKLASEHAGTLTAMIHAERPAAQWDDRHSLEKLVLELEIAAEAQRNEQRRARLRELADELDAGHVQHRFESRTTLLNGLRTKAVEELRAQAAVEEQARELPGPEAPYWLPWACNLQDERDQATLTRLRTEFPALERFTGEMEEIYWKRGRASQDPPGPPASADGDGQGSMTSRAGAGSTTSSQSDNVIQRSVSVSSAVEPVRTVSTTAAVAERNVPGTLREVSAIETATATLESEPAIEAGQPTLRAEPLPQVEKAPATEPVVATLFGHHVPLASDAEPAVTEPASSETVSDSDTVAVEEEPASSIKLYLQKLTALALRNRLATGAAAFVVLSGLFFAIIYMLHGRSQLTPMPTASANVAPAAAAASSELTPDAGVASAGTPDSKPSVTAPGDAKPKGPLLHKLAAEGAQDSIALIVENCGRGTGAIECWGYVSNVGGASSHISLEHADVVDSHGNSFSVDRGAQFAFPTGRASDIPAGSRARFTLKVPDQDLEARTLTLYMDLSNPRSLEYTFRDIPVAQ